MKASKLLLRLVSDGKCPLCGGTVYSAYLPIEEDPDEPNEHGIECDGCGEQYRIEDELESPDESA